MSGLAKGMRSLNEDNEEEDGKKGEGERDDTRS